MRMRRRQGKRAGAAAMAGEPGMPRRGLVLGAGGVLGAAWTIGALSALEQAEGWDPRTAEFLVGTSAGSVLAAFLGCGVGSPVLLNHQRGIPAEGDPRLEYDYDEGGALPPRPRLRLGSPPLLVNTALRPWRMTPMAALASVLPQGRGSLRPLAGLIESVAPNGSWAPHPGVWIVGMDYSTGRRVTFGQAGAPPAALSEAVAASCAIPGWYAPVEIGGRRYVDGGACSHTSLDLLAGLGLDEVVVLAPMASFAPDRPATVAARVERRFRRMATRRLLRESALVRRGGTRVTLLAPGAEDLAAIGPNMMDPSRRESVLETSLRTSAVALARPGGLAAAG